MRPINRNPQLTEAQKQALERLMSLRDALRELHAQLEYAALRLRLQRRRRVD